MTINGAQLNQSQLLSRAKTPADEKLKSARELKDAYTDFVGKTFFGQMMKSMRSTVGKPAYFHGGQTEEVFSSQLDQQMADSMSAASAAQISEPIFARQFPEQAKLLADAEKAANASIVDLANLRRR